MGHGTADALSGAGDDTFPKLIARNARTWADRTAMREKDFGIWQSWTWADVYDEVRALALGLREMGLERGDKIAIIGHNRPRLYWTFAAAQSLGAIPVPVYQDSVADEMVFVLDHAEVRFAMVEDQEQVDKLLSISDKLPKLEHIIYDEERGLKNYDHGHLHAFEEVASRGAEILTRDADAVAAWEADAKAGKAEDIAVMLYTSGTTGTPKGVMLSYHNLVVSALNGNAFDKLDETEEIIAYLPMAWVGDHIFCYCQSITAGFCVNCPESPDTVTEDRREIAPTYFFAPPRVFENLLTSIMVRMEDAGRLKKAMFDFFMSHARRVGEPLLNGDSVGAGDRLLY